jgi:hypothetical protein
MLACGEYLSQGSMWLGPDVGVIEFTQGKTYFVSGFNEAEDNFFYEEVDGVQVMHASMHLSSQDLKALVEKGYIKLLEGGLDV